MLASVWKLLNTGATILVVSLIRCYQVLISPLLGHHCRYFPSCSEYSLTAVREHGLPQGLSLSFSRVCSCHPFSSGGFDPVPSKEKETS